MNKKKISVLLLLCMLVSLMPGMAISANAESATGIPDYFGIRDYITKGITAGTEAVNSIGDLLGGVTGAADVAESVTQEVFKDCDFMKIFNSKIYVKANKAAGLEGDVSVKFDSPHSTATLYLPGSASTENLYFFWDNENLTVSKDGVVYESGTAPVANPGEKIIYQVSNGKATANIAVETLKGSAGVAGMFFNVDESLGNIKAMNSDSDHETMCYGNLTLDNSNYYMSLKGRGNSSWIMPKKPYNITIYKEDKKADPSDTIARFYSDKKKAKLIQGVEKKKWTLVANYLDNSLLRNKIAFDLAENLGIGLKTRFVDVWMNGEYLGNYLLTPRKDFYGTDEGYVLDNDHIEEDIATQFAFPNIEEMPGKHNVINVEDFGDDAFEYDTDTTEGAAAATAEIETYFTEAWNTVLDLNSEDYQKYFDLDSWAKMYLMFEVSKTYDCYAGNILMHRDGTAENDKLIAGPVWDYDVSFGRTLHKFLVGVTEPMQLNAEGWYNDSIGMVAVDKPYTILQGLGMHRSFMQRVAEIYNEYKWAFEDTVNNVDVQREFLRASANMNNDLWDTNHIGGEFSVAPNTMSALGTGKYRLNYENTYTWDNYVNNLKEYCGKRVMWLSDHLYAEPAVGSITKSLINNDSSVELRVVLTSGNQGNSYQWQSSSNGKKWVNIEGATNAALRLTAEEADNAMQYRCIVKNDGVNIYTTHGGKVKASVQTILDPVTVDVSVAVDVSEVELQNGTLTLVMDGKEIGEYTFVAAGEGWNICNKSGKYLAANGKSFTLSDKPFAWNYDNGVFSANTKVSYTAIGRLLHITHNEKAYLALDGSKLAISMSEGAQASFLLRVEHLINLA